MDFDTLYSILFEEFKKSPKHVHLYNVPMFSIYVKKEHEEHKDILLLEDVVNAFKAARNTIIKMGFSSMHVNVLFNDLSTHSNHNTGSNSGGVAGRAHYNGKFMEIAIHVAKRFDKETTTAYDRYLLRKIIVHEWAHLWMFNNSAGFKKAVTALYTQILNDGKQKYSPDTKNKHTFGSYIIDSESDDKLYTTLTTKLAYLISDYYTQELVFLYPDTDEYFKKERENNRESNLVKSVGDIVDALVMMHDSLIGIGSEPIGRNNEHIQKLKDTLSQTISQHLPQYIDTAIGRDLNDFEYGDLKLPEGETDIYTYLLAYKTENNKHIVLTGGKDRNNYQTLDTNAHYASNEKMDAYTLYESIYSAFVSAINSKLVNRAQHLSGKEYNNLREQISKLVGWVNDYGMSNDLELWATGVENFLALPLKYRKEIIRLMGTQEQRATPNRTMRKKMK